MTLPLDGIFAVVTGDIPGMTRDQAKDVVIRLGGISVLSIGVKTNLLIAGDNAGISKMRKARQQRLNVLLAADFIALADNPLSWDGLAVGHAAPAPPKVAPKPLLTHPCGSASGTFEGVWAVRAWCFTCEWKLQGTRQETLEAIEVHHKL